METLATRDPRWKLQIEALLLAENVAHAWLQHADHTDIAVLDVATSELETVSLLLSEMVADDRQFRPLVTPDSSAKVGLLLQPPFAFGLALAALMLVFFWVTGDVSSRSVWMKKGILDAVSVVRDHEWWRLVTAATLHHNMQHVLSNCGFMLLLMWAAAERLGLGISLAIWLLTAIGGFGVSLGLSPVLLTLGASGGLFGLLGAATGHALGHAPVEYSQKKYARWRVVGGSILLFAATAFSPHANLAAHAGGYCLGFILGVAAPARAPSERWQSLAAAFSALILISSWIIAIQNN